MQWLGSARLLTIMVVEALSLYPILFLNVSAALANLDPAMEQAAANLGAGRWTRFRRITLPLLRPGLFAGGTIVLIWSFTELGTPLMFDFYKVTSVQVFQRLSQVEGSPIPYALVVVVMLLAFGYLAISLQFQAWFKDSPTLRNLFDVNKNPTLLLVAAPRYEGRSLSPVRLSVITKRLQEAHHSE